MRKFAPYFLGLALAITPAISRADDQYKEKTKVQGDGDVITKSKGRDPVTGKKVKNKTTVEHDDGDVKYKSKEGGEKVKGKVDFEGDKVKVKEKVKE